MIQLSAEPFKLSATLSQQGAGSTEGGRGWIECHKLGREPTPVHLTVQLWVFFDRTRGCRQMHASVFRVSASPNPSSWRFPSGSSLQNDILLRNQAEDLGLRNVTRSTVQAWPKGEHRLIGSGLPDEHVAVFLPDSLSRYTPSPILDSPSGAPTMELGHVPMGHRFRNGAYRPQLHQSHLSMIGV